MTRIALFNCDQSDTAELRKIAAEHGPFDIIIDDGAHLYAETFNCFGQLFDSVREGGYYVIEDWGVGYLHKLQPRFGGRFGKTMVTRITDIMRSIPGLALSGYQLILDTHKSLAFFRRGAPWSQ